MKCKNIATENHSLYVNPNGLCNKCMIIKEQGRFKPISLKTIKRKIKEY
tara:strand:+ start:314 stop:460 length:147 start_codon:yes stop_codon:yes gene_type:complete